MDLMLAGEVGESPARRLSDGPAGSGRPSRRFELRRHARTVTAPAGPVLRSPVLLSSGEEAALVLGFALRDEPQAARAALLPCWAICWRRRPAGCAARRRADCRWKYGSTLAELLFAALGIEWRKPQPAGGGRPGWETPTNPGPRTHQPLCTSPRPIALLPVRDANRQKTPAGGQGLELLWNSHQGGATFAGERLRSPPHRRKPGLERALAIGRANHDLAHRPKGLGRPHRPAHIPGGAIHRSRCGGTGR